MTETKSSTEISTRLRQVAKQAKDHPEWQFTTLAHHIDIDLLREAVRRTRKDGAVGVDGVTYEDYAVDLEANLQSLLDRAKSGRYRAPAVRRAYIPKGDGRQRPLGIPTFEDKVLQRAVVMVLEALYEQDFLDCSYGFRPGRSAHDALDALRAGVMNLGGGGYVIEADIRDCFGAFPHDRLREILSQRMRDGVLTRLIGKWLNAGVLEEGLIERSETGTPQGGVISPLLANIFMHHVLDVWFETEVKPRLRGRALLVRYADDFVIVLERRDDAERVYEVLPKRFAKFGLTLHPEKTKLLDFRRPGAGRDPASFDFLGFTHLWARSRRGYWVVKQFTAASRLRRALCAVSEWCRAHRHLSVRDQHQMLVRKLRGHCAYYGITGNSDALERYRHGLLMLWRKWLMRRSNAARQPWAWWTNLCRHYVMPPAIAVHSVLRRS
ncbi:MAG TPA: group II intron reverse transcriptase/maturase [Micropruina sp.]|nr:group II intron reverse transcriptase/maturase [Micropruina sp.]